MDFQEQERGLRIGIGFVEDVIEDSKQVDFITIGKWIEDQLQDVMTIVSKLLTVHKLLIIMNKKYE